MPFRVRLDEARGFIIAEGSGAVTADEIAEAYESAIHTTRGSIIGQRSLTLFSADTSLDQLDFDSLERLKARVRTWLSTYPSGRVKSALVAPGSLQLTVLNLWRALVEADARINRDVRVFLTEREAVAWLMESA